MFLLVTTRKHQGGWLLDDDAVTAAAISSCSSSRGGVSGLNRRTPLRSAIKSMIVLIRTPRAAWPPNAPGSATRGRRHSSTQASGRRAVVALAPPAPGRASALGGRVAPGGDHPGGEAAELGEGAEQPGAVGGAAGRPGDDVPRRSRALRLGPGRGRDGVAGADPRAGTAAG